MINEIISSGFGGQGVLLLGQLITYAGMIEGKYVSWLPSYGPEMRGGTANCNVIVSSDPVGSPVVTEADTIIALNKPSLDKFESALKPGGRLFINSSIIDRKTTRNYVAAYYIPASDLAVELGNAKVANMIMLGAYVTASKTITKKSIMNGISIFLGKNKSHLIKINENAFDVGANMV